MRHLIRPQGRIAYDLYGAENDNGTLVICVPGMFDHRASFRFVGEALAGAGHRVAAMDLRGHGDSDTTFDDYTNRAAAADAIALAEELGGRDIVMVGTSMGGAAVTIAALERPDLVAGIVPMSAFLRSGKPGMFMRTALWLMLLRPWGPRLLAGFYDHLHKGREPQGHREQVQRVLTVLRTPDRFRAVRRTVRAPHREVSAAPRLRARAVVVGGELDPDWKDPAAEAAWVGSVVQGPVVMLPECGHYPQSQRPDLVVPVLEELLTRVSTDV